jgi:hypothetical protein
MRCWLGHAAAQLEDPSGAGSRHSDPTATATNRCWHAVSFHNSVQHRTRALKRTQEACTRPTDARTSFWRHWRTSCAHPLAPIRHAVKLLELPAAAGMKSVPQSGHRSRILLGIPEISANELATPPSSAVLGTDALPVPLTGWGQQQGKERSRDRPRTGSWEPTGSLSALRES